MTRPAQYGSAAAALCIVAAAIWKAQQSPVYYVLAAVVLVGLVRVQMRGNKATRDPRYNDLAPRNAKSLEFLIVLAFWAPALLLVFGVIFAPAIGAWIIGAVLAAYALLWIAGKMLRTA